VWCENTALKGKVADEMMRRGGDDPFRAGEPITIRRLEQRESASGNTYWPFEVTFGEAELRTPAAIFGLPAHNPDQTQLATDDDAIPF
jgi:hypothetical protein